MKQAYDHVAILMECDYYIESILYLLCVTLTFDKTTSFNSDENILFTRVYLRIVDRRKTNLLSFFKIM